MHSIDGILLQDKKDSRSHLIWPLTVVTIPTIRESWETWAKPELQLIPFWT